jgi:Mrp family chromosome partitioning ATPase
LFDWQGSAEREEEAGVAMLAERIEGRLGRPRRRWGEVLSDLLGKSLEHCASLGVCPASPRQGAAYLTAAFGEWITQYADEPVLLVEANLRHPGLAALLGAPAGPGLVEALYDGVETDQVIHRAALARVSVLPAGRPLRERREKEELGRRFRGYYGRLQQRYPNMIIDLPAADDAEYLTFPFDVPDAIVLAVAPRVTRVSEIQSAGRRLTASGSNVVAAMLNEEK